MKTTHFVVAAHKEGRYVPVRAICGRLVFEKEHSNEPTCVFCKKKLREENDDEHDLVAKAAKDDL